MRAAPCKHWYTDKATAMLEKQEAKILLSAVFSPIR